MTDTNDCQDRHETIAALVLGELEDAAADEIKQHIDTCENCRLLYLALTEEEETIQSAFKAVDDRSKELGAGLVEQFAKGSRIAQPEPAIFYRLWTGSGVPKRVAELAAAAVVIIGVFIAIYQFGGSTVAWADVVDKFRSMPFFSASIYFKDDVTSEPRQMELWMSRTGKTRVRIGTQVIFGHQGEIVDAFDIKTRARVEADEPAAFFLKKIGEAGEFSLDSIIRVMFGGTMQDVTPLVNPDAVISQDMIVFDVEMPASTEWVRIWALRESRLPVRIKVWNPQGGNSADAIFEYSREQADEFFDPDAFDNVLRTGNTSSRVNLAYAFLQDPGGKKITPEEMFARSGYHMPQVKDVGITPEGAVWITAGKTRNHTPNGNPFHGFSRIADGLGRTYFRVRATHRYRGDTSLDIFVPIDFPFDDREPAKITLFCEAEKHITGTKPVLVGTVDLTEWKQNAPCPDPFGSGHTDTLSLKISLAYKLKDAGKLNSLLQTIPEWSEQPGNASLLRFWMQTLSARGNYAEVVRIGRVFCPLVLEKPREIDRYGFEDYLIALAISGRIDEAAELFKKIDAIDDMPPTKSQEKYYNRFVQSVAESLAGEANLTPDQINKILGFDISQHRQ